MADDGVSAADVMGTGSEPDSPTGSERSEPAPVPDQQKAPATEPPGKEDSASDSQQSESPKSQQTEHPVRKDGGQTGGLPEESAKTGQSAGREADQSAQLVERQTVRITDDIDTFVGFDDREYDLAENDVVTLPATNVKPLVEQDVAEPFD